MALKGMQQAASPVHVDALGHLDLLTDPTGSSTSVFWTSFGLVTQVLAAGSSTAYSYDDGGRLTSSTDADGVTTSWSRSAAQDSIAVQLKSPLGLVATYTASRPHTSVRLERSFKAPDGETTTSDTLEAGGGVCCAQEISLADGTTISIGAQAAPALGPQAVVRSP